MPFSIFLFARFRFASDTPPLIIEGHYAATSYAFDACSFRFCRQLLLLILPLFLRDGYTPLIDIDAAAASPFRFRHCAIDTPPPPFRFRR